MHYDLKTKQLSSFFMHKYSMIHFWTLPVFLKRPPGAESVGWWQHISLSSQLPCVARNPGDLEFSLTILQIWKPRPTKKTDLYKDTWLLCCKRSFTSNAVLHLTYGTHIFHKERMTTGMRQDSHSQAAKPGYEWESSPMYMFGWAKVIQTLQGLVPYTGPLHLFVIYCCELVARLVFPKGVIRQTEES